jgi:succinyl-CoA synthetase alpha subunit
MSGAIVSGGKGGAELKTDAIDAAGIKAWASPARPGTTLAELLRAWSQRIGFGFE